MPPELCNLFHRVHTDGGGGYVCTRRKGSACVESLGGVAGWGTRGTRHWHVQIGISV